MGSYMVKNDARLFGCRKGRRLDECFAVNLRRGAIVQASWDSDSAGPIQLTVDDVVCHVNQHVFIETFGHAFDELGPPSLVRRELGGVTPKGVTWVSDSDPELFAGRMRDAMYKELEENTVEKPDNFIKEEEALVAMLSCSALLTKLNTSGEKKGQYRRSTFAKDSSFSISGYYISKTGLQIIVLKPEFDSDEDSFLIEVPQTKFLEDFLINGYPREVFEKHLGDKFYQSVCKVEKTPEPVKPTSDNPMAGRFA